MTITETTTTTATAPTNLTGNYTLDPVHSRVGFSARHAMVTKVRGAFDEFEGSGYIDQETPANSHFELTIKVASIDTRNVDRDNHLRTNDFFAMDQYPEITFRTTKIEPVDGTHFNVKGDLTVRGVTKEVTVAVEYKGAVIDPWGNTRLGFEGGTTINRKDWGVNWNMALEAGGVLVSEKVNLELELAAVKALLTWVAIGPCRVSRCGAGRWRAARPRPQGGGAPSSGCVSSNLQRGRAIFRALAQPGGLGATGTQWRGPFSGSQAPRSP